MGTTADRLYHIRKFFKMLRTGKKAPDDYDWQFYADIYREGLEDIARDHTLILREGDYAFDGERLTLQRDIKPLHPNYHITYETLLQLSPETILEGGCGGGDHLHNLHVLNPRFGLHGVDVSQGQVALLRRRHPDLKAWVEPRDLTAEPGSIALPRVEAAFTQAVIMHIRQNHTNALANLIGAATRWFVLVENWKRHDFLADLQGLFQAGRIPWKGLHVHYRESSALGIPLAMVVSAEPLPRYPVLTDYRILRDVIAGV
jgi:hypothetical protein